MSLLQNSPVPDKSRTKEKQSSTDSADYTDFFWKKSEEKCDLDSSNKESV
jgi:hypothetical protein